MRYRYLIPSTWCFLSWWNFFYNIFINLEKNYMKNLFQVMEAFFILTSIKKYTRPGMWKIPFIVFWSFLNLKIKVKHFSPLFFVDKWWLTAWDFCSMSNVPINCCVELLPPQRNNLELKTTFQKFSHTQLGIL